MLQSSFQYKRPRPSSKLNLVALMDIFTILVFFLLLNSGEADKLESAKFVHLPDSEAGTSPHSDLVVLIGEDDIWLGEDVVVSIDEVAESGESSIEALGEALADYRGRMGDLNSYEEQNGLALTIMGDRAVPFALLKSVMVTCRLENFRDIALAVNQVGAPVSAPQESGGGKSAPELAARATNNSVSLVDK